MTKQFALDLRHARKLSGFTQSDIAHLLRVNASRISDLEHGKRQPSNRELCALSLIYGRSFESFFGSIMTDTKSQLRERLQSLPVEVRHYAGTFNRQTSIDRLADHLSDVDPDHGAA